MSPLESSGKPLFFKAGDMAQDGVRPPPGRHGVAVRSVARSLAGMQKEALIGSSATGAIWRLASDEGAYLMGEDIAPCPLAFMTTGMVASFMEELLVVAGQRGIPLGKVRLIQDNYYTMEGSALRGTMAGGALPVDLALEAESPAKRDALAGLLEDAIAASPVTALLENVLPSRFTLTHNGREIQTGRVMTIGRPAQPYPQECFEKAEPAPDNVAGLISRNGMSPKTSEATSSAGSSYAQEQSRRLHLRGICTLRPDGLKAVEQQLLNPHGSIFHFLSEEGPQAGGGGRAPDAMTYLSAGIAFCFMTQFGRYAKIVRKNLSSYTVVQDTHFSIGGRGERVPKADAVETHVYLESTEDDDFARTVLDMAEQTCFLHALCRSEVKVNTALAARSTDLRHDT
jgi:organic hydroperoxide reductase OsmC/OhrA